MIDDEKKPLPASTIRPPRPTSVPRPDASPTVPRVATSNDRPTPRSTVIPRMPSSPIRPRQETLIFHGAPPIPPATPTKTSSPIVMLPPPLTGPFDDVQSAELLDDADLEDAERDTPYGEQRTARTFRPPPIVIPRHRREMRVIAAISVALMTPLVFAVFLFGGPSHRSHTTPTTTAAQVPAMVAARPTRTPGTCAVDGAPKLLSRHALVRGGVEGMELDDRVAFAALSSTKSGTAFELDARTLDVKSTAKVVSSDPLSHVVPELTDGAPIEAETDARGLRTFADAEGDAAFGARDGFAVWGPRDGDGMVRLWRLPWPQTIDASRVISLGSSGERAVVFRRAGAIWIGSFRAGQTTSALAKLSTSRYAGSPTLDAQGDEAVVAWAEREERTPWGIRWARWTSQAGPGAVHPLELPPGGPGDRAMAPSVAALGDGRFLLAWTEAGSGRNQVRAEVIDATDHVTGEPLAVSPGDLVAGQGTIALTDSGRGAIAYLVAKRSAFELRASAIDCVP